MLYRYLVKQEMNYNSLSKTIWVGRLCNFQILYKKSLIISSVVTVICIGIKWVLLDTKLTTVITTLKLTDSGSSIQSPHW